MAERTRKQVGTWAETCTRHHFAMYWPDVRRIAPMGASDVGDLDGVPDLCIQVKNHRSMALATWIEEARKQARTAHKRFFVVVHRRRQKAVAEWYVTMPLQVFTDIYRQACATHIDN